MSKEWFGKEVIYSKPGTQEQLIGRVTDCGRDIVTVELESGEAVRVFTSALSLYKKPSVPVGSLPELQAKYKGKHVRFLYWNAWHTGRVEDVTTKHAVVLARMEKNPGALMKLQVSWENRIFLQNAGGDAKEDAKQGESRIQERTEIGEKDLSESRQVREVMTEPDPKPKPKSKTRAKSKNPKAKPKAKPKPKAKTKAKAKDSNPTKRKRKATGDRKSQRKKQKANES